jgi:hypothetical protein
MFLANDTIVSLGIDRSIPEKVSEIQLRVRSESRRKNTNVYDHRCMVRYQK